MSYRDVVPTEHVETVEEYRVRRKRERREAMKEIAVGFGGLCVILLAAGLFIAILWVGPYHEIAYKCIRSHKVLLEDRCRTALGERKCSQTYVRTICDEYKRKW